MTYYGTKIKTVHSRLYSNKAQVETVISIRNYIKNNYQQNLKLDSLSRVLFVSKYHMIRLFKRYYGLTPRQYLIDTRIEKSKELLLAGLSVTETCYDVGFDSLGSFSSLFRRKTGLSPSQFQKSNFEEVI